MKRNFKKEIDYINDVINHLEIDKRYANETTVGFLEALQEEYRKKLQEVNRDKAIAGYKRKKKTPDGFISEEDIVIARSIPIENFVKVNRVRKALCLFHADKNASMHIYEHSYYCFSCHASGTAIDIIMKLQNTDFKGAVLYLLNR
jgi:hypothetical protein